jgi:hypothetical protein
MSTSTAPKGFEPELDFDGELTSYAGPDIERPGFKIQTMWTPDRGTQLWIDHHQDNAFTVAEVQDLISTLTAVVRDHA